MVEYDVEVVREQRELYVARCVHVDIASQGQTPAAAVANLGEALRLYFEDDESRPVPDGYWAVVVHEPGCFASGATTDELAEAVEEAITLIRRHTQGR